MVTNKSDRFKQCVAIALAFCQSTVNSHHSYNQINLYLNFYD
ncbi:hypothetical protein NWP21_16780 [Anabaenopsis sp. FSS-46]|nr:hypothetical protein [Anabaenopsis sp. FSS-46]MDH6100463.1 hypothetical protein [Anabaenopsis sp. FSS-46]